VLHLLVFAAALTSKYPGGGWLKYQTLSTAEPLEKLECCSDADIDEWNAAAM
jgi:hypothetical protein